LAVVADGAPAAAVVHAPALGLTHEATLDGPALLNGTPIRVSGLASLSEARIAGPRFALDALMQAGLDIRPMEKIPSLAHRLCKVADGSIGAALASKDANDWDIAAAQLILERAGGKLADLDGRVPRYNRETTLHDRLFGAAATGFEPMLGEVRRAIGLPLRVSGASERS
jgi:myo-inositol-1(or 4)-monophosphatase